LIFQSNFVTKDSTLSFSRLQGDIFSGLNDGLLSRAEALAAVDMQKHQSSHAAHQQMTQQLKVI
jgi:class 4 POU domain transcription factor